MGNFCWGFFASLTAGSDVFCLAAVDPSGLDYRDRELGRRERGPVQEHPQQARPGLSLCKERVTRR